MSDETIGLIAGNRDLPLMVTAKAKELGHTLVAVGLAGETEPALEEMADRFTWIKLGQLQKMIDFFKASHVRQVIMIGGISREGLVLNYEPDELAVSIMESLSDFHTDKILRAVTAKLEEFGLEVRSAIDILPELLVKPGILTKKAPDASLLADLKVAWRIAKELGRLDISQCAVVSDKITLALEGADGTDATVARGGALAVKPVAVAKVVKPGQDLRLDPPVIGPETIKVMAQSNVGVLGVDASSVLIVDRAETVRLADEAGLALVAWTDEMVK